MKGASIMLRSIRLVALEQQHYHIPALSGIHVDQIKTQRVPAIRKPVQVDRVTLYTCSDVPAVMLIAGAIDDFRRCVGWLPRVLTVHSLTLIAYALATRESNYYYYIEKGHVKRIRLESMPGMDEDEVLCEG